MKPDLFIGIFAAAGIHALVVFGHQLLPASAAPSSAAKEEVPIIALKPLPQLEPEPPDQDDLVPPPPDSPDTPPPEIAPPMQADVPAPIVNTAFTQTLQPPPPPNLGGPSTAITIPKSSFTHTNANLKNIFDLNQLDKKPTPTFAPKPNYPYEMRRARVSGEVIVGFMLDSEGNVVNPYIVRSTNSGFDNEALRTVQRWKFSPGKVKGKNVATRSVHLPLTFTLPKE
jgi:protein TonB